MHLNKLNKVKYQNKIKINQKCKINGDTVAMILARNGLDIPE